jgi:thioredoxin reductase (NADPH)
MENYEVIIIGAGSAGLSAAIYAIRSGLRTLVIDDKLAGGTISDAPIIVNYPGFSQIAGHDLAEKMVLHARKIGAQIHELEPIKEINFKSEIKTVKTSKATYQATAIIFATGSHYKEANIKGEKEFRGRGVSYCGVCDGPFFKNKTVIVVGGGNSACTSTLYLSGLAAKVIVVHRRAAFRAEEYLVKDITTKNNVQVLWNSVIQEIKGDKQVTGVTIQDLSTGQTSDLAVNAVFVQVGEAPNSQIAQAAGVETDERGYIKININQQTNIDGVFAAGDVTTHPVKQVGTAVGQGITAALDAYAFIKQPYYRK